MKAHELLSRLKHLTLSGRVDGEYEWIGTREQWEKVDKEDIAAIL